MKRFFRRTSKRGIVTKVWEVTEAEYEAGDCLIPSDGSKFIERSHDVDVASLSCIAEPFRDYNSIDLRALTDSMDEVGQLEPISLFNDGVRVIDGWCRVLVARRLGWKTIRVYDRVERITNPEATLASVLVAITTQELP